MNLSRREFLRAVTLAAGTIGLEASGILEISKALGGTGDPPVIWLQGQSCSGCSVSLLNSIEYGTIDTVLMDKISLDYHNLIMASAGDFAVSATEIIRPSIREISEISGEWLETGPELGYDLNNDSVVNLQDFAILANRQYILVVEGAIPVGSDGAFCHFSGQMDMVGALNLFSEHASHVIAVGTCASFGGIPAASPGPTGALSVTDALEFLGKSKSVINIPGCPIHPDWVIGTILHLVTQGQPPLLDELNRPMQFFPPYSIHQVCPRVTMTNPYAQQPGDPGCLLNIGCKGPQAHADCSERKWNSPDAGQPGVNWCIGAGAPCIGCTEQGFPDGMTPFHRL